MESELEGQEVLLGFLEWLQEIVASNDGVLGSKNEAQLWNLSIFLSFVTQYFKSMQAYGNHLQVTNQPNVGGMVTYDSSVLGEFEHPLVST